MSKKNKNKNKEPHPAPEPAEPKPQAGEPETADLTDVTIPYKKWELIKAIIQEAILVKDRQRSSVIDLDRATGAYLDFVGEDQG
jgi:hypothetical protein